MRSALLVLALALLLSAATLKLVTSDSYYGAPVMKIKTDFKNYLLAFHLGDGDDADYCCGYTYYLDDDHVTVYRVYGTGRENMVKKGTVKLNSKYDILVATKYGFVVCNQHGCIAYTRNGEVKWSAPIEVSLSDLHYFTPLVNGTIYFLGKDKKSIIAVDSNTGQVKGIMKLLFKVNSMSNCYKYIALVGDDKDDNGIVELYEVEPDGSLKIKWDLTRAWYLQYSSLGEECKYLLVSSLTNVYLIDVEEGKVIASRNTYNDLLLPKGYIITAIDVSPEKIKGKTTPIVTVLMADFEYLSSKISSIDVSDLWDFGNTYNEILMYIPSFEGMNVGLG